MKEYELGEMEDRFARLIWAHAPVSSGDLVKLCGEEFQWKKSTTYTMLKRLCQRGLFKNEGGMVTVLMSQEEFRVLQGEAFLEESFGGSLPSFLAAFSKRRKLSAAEVAKLRQMIDDYEEE